MIYKIVLQTITKYEWKQYYVINDYYMFLSFYINYKYNKNILIYIYENIYIFFNSLYVNLLK